MRPAAKLDRIMIVVRRTHAEHAHFIAIFLTEQRQRARRDGVVGRHQTRRYRLVAADLRVHIRLDLRDLLGGQRLRVREVEAEEVLGDEARSEESRVGKEGFSKCRSREWPDK